MIQQGIFGPQLINPSDDLDEKLLTELASETGGRYFRARDLQELAKIYQLLDQLEPIEREQITYRPQQSLLHWPLLAAFVLLLLLLLPRLPWQALNIKRKTQPFGGSDVR
jgi:Ca-activated chloride channel family protein